MNIIARMLFSSIIAMVVCGAGIEICRDNYEKASDIFSWAFAVFLVISVISLIAFIWTV